MNDEQMIWERYKTLIESPNDYQYGDCMFFSQELLDSLESLLPKHKLKYELILGYREYEKEDREDVLVHVYINIDDIYYLDSVGINGRKDIDSRIDEWMETQKYNLLDYVRKYDEMFSYDCWVVSDYQIPPNLIPTKCDTVELKRDITNYLNRVDIRDLLNKLK